MKRLLLIVCLIFAVSVYAVPFGLVDTKKLSVKVLSAVPTVLPAAGKQFIYPRDDGFWYTLNSAGTETRLSPFIASVFGRVGAIVAQAGDYTAADVGLANVDNTSDLNKPISTATQTALDLKLNNAGVAADLNISAMTTEASPATGMYLVVDVAGTRKKINWSSLPSASGGEVNTASNTGTSGIGIFKEKSGVDLSFYKLYGFGGISFTLNGTDRIDAKLNITGLTEESTPASGDYFVMYDTTAGSYKKIDSDNMPGSGGGASTFLDLSDTPASFTPGKWLKVNAGGDGIEETDAPSGGGGTQILSSISGESFIYPKPGINNPFSNAANSANITFDVDNYADAVALLSTSNNEPMQLPKFKITGTTSLKFRFIYSPEAGNSWNSESVIWKGQYKHMNDNVAWSTVTSFDIGTDTVPSSGSAPQLYEVTISLATLGLSIGDVVQSVIYIDNTSTWANDVAFQLGEIEVVQ